GGVKRAVKEVGSESQEPRVSQSPSAAISGLIPTMFMTRVRLYARTERAISAATFGRVLVRKCVALIRAFIVPNGCSTVSRRRRMASGFASSRCCTASSRCSCSHRAIRRSGPVVHRDLSEQFLTGGGPVTTQHLAVFFVCIAIRQSLPSWAAIGVLIWQISKVLFTEASVRLGARCQRLGQSYRDAGFVAREDLRAIEVAAISYSVERLGL